MKRCLFIFAVFALLPGLSQASDPMQACLHLTGGWRALCLQDLSQQLDQTATATYWKLQRQVQALPLSVRSKDYSQEFSYLLRRNELDFTTYSESYCNMQTVLIDEDTEIDKLLKCMIKTSQLRITELNSIISIVSKSQGSK